MRCFKISFFSLMILLNSCSTRAPQDLAGEVFIEQFSKHVKKTQGLRMYGSGGGFLNDINCLSFYFYSPEILDLQEARRYLVENVELLLNWINSSIELAPYFHENPYTYRGVELSFSFTKACSPDSRMISNVFLDSKGCVGYYIYNPILDSNIMIHHETYKKACGLLEHQKSLDNLASFPEACFQ